MTMTESNKQVGPFGTESEPQARTARDTVNEMVDAGLLDEMMGRVDAEDLRLTGEGGFFPEMIKAVFERGLQAELTDHLGYDKGARAGQDNENYRNGTTPKTLATEVGDTRLDRPTTGPGRSNRDWCPKEPAGSAAWTR